MPGPKKAPPSPAVAEALRLVREEKIPVKGAAARAGANYSTVKNWLRRRPEFREGLALKHGRHINKSCRSEQALALVDSGMSVSDAARACDISQPAVSKAARVRRKTATLPALQDAPETGFTYGEWQDLTGHPIRLRRPWHGLAVGTQGRLLGWLPAEVIAQGDPEASGARLAPGTGFLGAHLRVAPGTPASEAIPCLHGNARDPYETALALLSREALEAFEVLPKD